MNNLDTTIRYQDLQHQYFYQLEPNDAALIFDFFIVFSRFEFALKRVGYFTGDETRIKPNWDEFCKNIKDRFDKARTPELQKAYEYYLTYPPKKQIAKNNKVVWKKNVQGENETEFEWIIRSIRIVRNNLFHGGKFPYDQIRDNTLLFHGLVILHECLNFDENLMSIFYYDPL